MKINQKQIDNDQKPLKTNKKFYRLCRIPLKNTTVSKDRVRHTFCGSGSVQVLGVNFLSVWVWFEFTRFNFSVGCGQGSLNFIFTSSRLVRACRVNFFQFGFGSSSRSFISPSKWWFGFAALNFLLVQIQLGT